MLRAYRAAAGRGGVPCPRAHQYPGDTAQPGLGVALVDRAAVRSLE
ncbi:MAG: hypothetical protein U5L11_01325 [Arhodomonas sp.]|nr:hypothetical protein [Arhodomonas sp.]